MPALHWKRPGRDNIALPFQAPVYVEKTHCERVIATDAAKSFPWTIVTPAGNVPDDSNAVTCKACLQLGRRGRELRAATGQPPATDEQDE